MLAVVTVVNRPFASKVMTGTMDVLPIGPAAVITDASVNAVLPVASPVWLALLTNPEYRVFAALSPVLVPDADPVPVA